MKNRVLILGIDGYIGYPLAIELLKNKYEVCGLDNGSRRFRVKHLGSDSLTPIHVMREREQYLKSIGKFIDSITKIDLHDHYIISRILHEFKPDTIVHLAEQPSAPWSMKSANFAAQTQYENVIGTLSLLWAIKEHCPNVHLIKLGTMGEYGTPDCDIPEGFIPKNCIGIYDVDIEEEFIHSCPMESLLFPRSANSFYHLSKVHDTHNILFACKTWGLTSTDIMQGVVFGTGITDETESIELTRFDYDECFGTAINRFCTQAISNLPLTVYGEGNQIRGFLPLKDSIQCLKIAIDNKPKKGEYRTYNQFENIYSIKELAKAVSKSAKQLGIDTKITTIPNPRTELDKHYYNPEHSKLLKLGYKPTTNISREIYNLLYSILPYANRVNPSVVQPVTTWN